MMRMGVFDRIEGGARESGDVGGKAEMRATADAPLAP